MHRMHRRSMLTAGLAVSVTVAIGLMGSPAAQGQEPVAPHRDRAGAVAAAQVAGAKVAGATAPSRQDGALDVLFVGAHPDDEAGSLSTFGQWNEYGGVRAGVVTVTRGEGGGNAVGPEEGPPLGLLREAEERRAVGRAGITDVHNLDAVDFYYTVSEPLTARIWDHQATLAKVVRIVRETRPAVIVTMNPAPVPGQHGNHQEAGRLATEAFYAAADPTAFPDQIAREHLAPWRVSRLFTGGAAGTSVSGPDCAAGFRPADPTAAVFGVWSGRPSQRNGGRSWAQVEREAQREYASQGWSVFPDVSTDPARLGCDMFTQVDSRVPFTVDSTDPEAMLEGALRPARGGLPLGTEFWLSTSGFGVSAGVSFPVTAHLRAAPGRSLTGAAVRLSTPEGWAVAGDGRVGHARAGEATTTFTVTPPADAAVGARARVTATLMTRGGTGTTARAVQVRAAVVGTPQLLPGVADFEAWAGRAGVPQLTGSVTPVLTLGSGGERDVRVDLANTSPAPQSGTVSLRLPAGFTASPATVDYGPLAPGATGAVTVHVTNTDAALPTSNQGGAGGDYAYTVATTNSTGAPDLRAAALELVPTTVIPRATAAPTVDGVASAGEYTGTPVDLSRRWEGDDCTSAADCSGSAEVTWSGDDLYFLVRVTDDTLGTRLAAEDCKRHWRTDSVEIALDPRGGSENTSTTFKTGVLPVTAGGGPCFERDADNRQGDGPATAPGMRVAAVLGATGYTLEVKIPLALLPAAVDPARLAMNVFIYDSDTQDKTGQTRIGWSTWGGVQGDPYRWGLATLPGYTPPADRPTAPVEAVIPQTAARSVDSPQSILQAARTGVPLAGGAGVNRSDGSAGARLVGPARSAGGTAGGTTGGAVRARLVARGTGTAHLYVWDPTAGVLGGSTVTVTGAGSRTVAVPVDTARLTDGSVVLLAFEATRSGAVTGTEASTTPIHH